MIEAVLFDLDGTLADTAPDLGYALNVLLARYGKPALPIESIRPHVSHGARGMLQVGFGMLPADESFPDFRDQYLAIYADNLCRETVLFPGMGSLLESLESAGMPWGIVTNKPQRFTEPLIAALNLHTRAACVVSGDSAARAKPHPDTLLLATRKANINVRLTVYVGDDERDIQAAHAAGMAAVVALYGYLGVGSDPRTWGAEAMIQHPLELQEVVAHLAR